MENINQIKLLLASLPSLSHADYFTTLARVKDLYFASQVSKPLHLNFRQIDVWDSQKADADYQALLAQHQGNFKKAATVYFKQYLQGTMVKSGLGLVILNSKSKGKMIAFAQRKAIAESIARIPEILLYGEVGKKNTLNKGTDDSFVAFYEFSKRLEFTDKVILARIKVGERQDGDFTGYYIGAEQLDGMADSIKIPFKAPIHSPSCAKLNQLTSMTEQDQGIVGGLNGILGIKSQSFDVVNSMFDRVDGHAVVFEVILDSLQVVEVDKATGQEVVDMDSQSNQPFDREDVVLPVGKNARQKANDEAIALLAKVQSENLSRDELTQDELMVLAKYTGNGGNLVSADGQKGSAYEYYTPRALASGMWELAKQLGFNGGKVLDPSAGTGVFTATSPQNVLMDSIELDKTSGGIAQVLNDGERSQTTISPFESIAKTMIDGDDENGFDMVITNVPFGNNSSRGKNKLFDDVYQKESLDYYFVLRSLQKLKSGGLAIFITPTSTVSGKGAKAIELRQKTSHIAEFLGAYRLPNSVFKDTSADVVTDVIAFRKFNQATIEQISDYLANGDIDTLQKANVLWDEYIGGNYFNGVGKRFVLGEIQQSKNQFGDMVDKVVSTKSTSEIVKMLKKFPDSRIDWQLLNIQEPTVIDYHNGDMIYRNGKQYQYQDGVWLAIEKQFDEIDGKMNDLLAKLDSPYSILVHGVKFDDIKQLEYYQKQTGQMSLLTPRIQQIYDQAMRNDNPNVAFDTLCLSYAIDMLIEKHGYAYNFHENYPKISQLMKSIFLDAKNSKLTAEVRQSHRNIGNYYNKGKFNSVWRGEMQTYVKENANANHYASQIAKIQYENGSLYLTKEQLAKVQPDIDPLTDSDWFVNADGSKFIHIDDFLVGSLADRLADIDKQIDKCQDEVIKQKLVNQKMLAKEQCPVIDVRKVRFDLRSPLLDANVKLNFLKTVHPDAVLVFDDNQNPSVFIDSKNYTQAEDSDNYQIREVKVKLYKRIGYWLQSGNISLGGVKVDPMTEVEALNWITQTINEWNVLFNNWVKANDRLLNALNAKVNDPKNLYFIQNSDETPVDIAGINPSLKLHGYQNAFVRSQGRFFGGINGMGVGLGKTLSSLCSVQHAHNIGVKKRTLFVVPNSVLSNWRKEVHHAYTNTDDCIFVGLRQKGDKFSVSSSKYDEDLIEAINGKYRKIFMTFEAFRRIRLKDDTVENYANYLKQHDRAYAYNEIKKKNEKAEGWLFLLINEIKLNGTNNAPYLEDMNIDSLVIDEAHAFKNSIAALQTDDRIKFLAQPKSSSRGTDAQIKTWFIRNYSTMGDGVQLLTATPVTNSPLEIYSMLSLAMGRDVINGMMGGIHGADEFIQTTCQIDNQVMPTIDNRHTSMNVFTGLTNLQLLRPVINNTTTIIEAKDIKGVSVVIPDREEIVSSVSLSQDTIERLKQMQEAYQTARLIVKDEIGTLSKNHPLHPQNPNSSYQKLKQHFGESDELMAHPFNLIRKMDIMIADEEFIDGATFYHYDAKQEKLVEKAVEQFNKKSYVDNVSRLSVHTVSENAMEITEKDGNEIRIKGYKVKVSARNIIQSGQSRILIDSLDFNIQSAFESIAEKLGIRLSVNTPAKLALLLDNFKQEMANPRGLNSDKTTSQIVKQIIFCDHLFLHCKIKRLLVEKANVSADKIVIITGQTNNEPDVIIDIQDGFNEMGDDNRYQVVIANKKAEVGINLQKGTQAIHHLTTGWTPDSLEQRNGRGARQGNHTDKVHIYYYDADGTFDEFKRTMINQKDEWITNLLVNNEKNTLSVSGGMSKEDQEALINSIGNKDAILHYQQQKQAKEKLMRNDLAKQQQIFNINTIKKHAKIVESHSFKDFLGERIENVVNQAIILKDLEKKVEKGGRNAEIHRKNHEVITQKAIENIQYIVDSVNDDPKMNDSTGKPYAAEDILKFIIKETVGRGDFSKSDSFLWSNRFFRKFLPDRGNFDENIHKNSEYYQEYLQAIDISKQLVEQSILSIDEIASEIGGLPVGAGRKIANGQAVLIDGVYLEVGAFVNVESDSKHIFIVTNVENNKSSRIVVEYLIMEHEYLPQGKKYGLTIDLKDYESHLILPSDSRYLDWVKKAAKVEDDLLRLGKLTEPLYSKNIALVSEYRDDTLSVDNRVFYSIGLSFKDSHCYLKDMYISHLVPLDFLKSGCPLANIYLQKYQENGIEIDLDKRGFYVSRGLVFPNWITSDALVSRMAEFVKSFNIRLTKDDVKVLDLAVLQALAIPDVAKFDELIQGLKGEVLSLFNQQVNAKGVVEYVYRQNLSNDWLDIDVIDDFELLNQITTRNSTGKDLMTIIQVLQAQHETLALNNGVLNGLKPDDMVTLRKVRYFKDVVKDYAKKYGDVIHQSDFKGRIYNQNFIYNPDDDHSWTVQFKVYVRLIDVPRFLKAVENGTILVEKYKG